MHSPQWQVCKLNLATTKLKGRLNVFITPCFVVVFLALTVNSGHEETGIHHQMSRDRVRSQQSNYMSDKPLKNLRLRGMRQQEGSKSTIIHFILSKNYSTQPSRCSRSPREFKPPASCICDAFLAPV